MKRNEKKKSAEIRYQVNQSKLKYSTYALIRTRKGQTFFLELTNARINRNWGKFGIFAKYNRNVFFIFKIVISFLESS